MNATKLLYADAGNPAIGKTTEPADACQLCGTRAVVGVPAKKAYGANFSSYAELRDHHADHVCEACVWSFGSKPPMTLRLWSLVYREDRRAATGNPKAVYPVGPHTHLTSKNDMREVVDVLLFPPDGRWICTVAVSGQIHVVPFAKIAHGERDWIVRVEHADVRSTPDIFAAVLYHAASLSDAGFPRAVILGEDDPAPGLLVKLGIDVWREHSTVLRRYIGSPLLQLAVSCYTQETRRHVINRAHDRLDRV